ncbi:MAG: Two component transcriptional regulator, winged helix family [Candidatus Pacebacteria bacterium GW2011_GWF2_38_9]|nr:MAG: two component transcriptional regulator, winged helix family, two-component system, OmpR family, copper resistance phosphate regulon response regulator CusR [candidate division TM6 bacterium GW2011_GWF2_28_16]KKQ10344.1 MAG: Two component transcriptional regulator, winged helix family [Candidatus Pacebacteria bacterium GW2011_GWF1_36_5]KKQ88708.1 MAG: Two component transcriptional regulator, winged helix family [Candidatus Pacebacteria bacterium GW2011_GWF2_38_9]HAZ73647.1 DNA-binding re
MKVLLVEDEHRISQSIKKGLEQENFLVDLAYDGEKAFDLASSNEYEAIILDLMIPKMDGMTVCKNLRADRIHTPILILTAKGELEDKVTALNCGADDYLVKPFAFAELLARVRALTRRPKIQESFLLVVEDLELDIKAFEVKRSGKNIDLSKKEFALLEYLMRHKNRILSKDQIIESVWDYEADILLNTVEVYMGYLRNKIDKKFKDKKLLINTVRGFGYKIGD